MQFSKIEQVIISTNNLNTSLLYMRIIMNSEEIFWDLELPYRYFLCTGDMGEPQKNIYRNMDAWEKMYGDDVNLYGGFRHDGSNPYKAKDGKMYCHTLNNTAIASPRSLLSENYQQRWIHPHTEGAAAIYRKKEIRRYEATIYFFLRLSSVFIFIQQKH